MVKQQINILLQDCSKIHIKGINRFCARDESPKGGDRVTCLRSRQLVPQHGEAHERRIKR